MYEKAKATNADGFICTKTQEILCPGVPYARHMFFTQCPSAALDHPAVLLDSGRVAEGAPRNRASLGDAKRSFV